MTAAITAKQRAEAIQSIARASTIGAVLQLRAGGQPVTPAKRDEMLAKCAAGEYVELEVDIHAFEQKAGEPNRNFVRFRDGAMHALGRSGKNTPFLRDHRQGDSLARGGTITASTTEQRDEGEATRYSVNQTAKITAPWAVDLALRDLLSAVSIGWNPTGPVECSACGTNVLESCWHWPGDRLAESDNEIKNGKKKLVRKSDGPITVEWIYTSAELIETSAVPIPAVPAAHIEGIRAALAAHQPEHANAHYPEEDRMRLKLITILSLAAAASDDDIIAGVTALTCDRAELGIAKSELTIANAELATFKAAKLKTDEDSFVAEALSTGRIAAGGDKEWRELFKLAPLRARTLMSERAPSTVTPVGAPSQAGNPPANPPVVAEGAAAITQQHGASLASVRKVLAQGGISATDADKMIIAHVGKGA